MFTFDKLQVSSLKLSNFICFYCLIFSFVDFVKLHFHGINRIPLADFALNPYNKSFHYLVAKLLKNSLFSEAFSFLVAVSNQPITSFQWKLNL
jgi:hypothetical protein